jgi:RNA methyltransferase, TrmH family
VVEGAELLSAAIQAGLPIESVYVAPEGHGNPSVTEAVEKGLAVGARVFDLAPGVLERVSDTVTPQPVVAVVGFLPAALADLPGASLVVVCVDVRDPGNAGTMIRTADAAGADAVVCSDGTVDPTNPKTVRASAGSLFHLPVMVGGGASTIVERLQASGMTVVGTQVRDGVDYAMFDWRRPIALVFGNEASGLDASIRSRLDDSVSIPMVGGAQSLNVSVSAAVLCFEAQRQRRGPDGVGRPSRRPGTLRPTMPGMEEAPPEPGGRWMSGDQGVAG